MKNLLPAMAAALVALAAATGTCGDRRAAPPRYYGGIARRLCSMLPRDHVLQHAADRHAQGLDLLGAKHIGASVHGEGCR